MTTPKNRKVQLTFPILPHNDLLKCMSATGLPLNDHDLQKPNKENMMRFFVEFAAAIMHIQYGYIGQYDTSANSYVMQLLSETCDHPQLHKDSLPHMWFFKELTALLENVVGVGEFSIKDLIKPDPNRIKVILSGLVNFLRFREDSMSIYEELAAKSEQILKQKEAAIIKNYQLKQKLDDLKRKRQEQISKAAQMEDDNIRLSHMVQSRLADGDKLRKRGDAAQQECSSVESKIENVSQQIQALNEECQRLQSLIVPNPQELKDGIRKLRDRQKELKAHYQHEEQKRNEIESKIVSLSQIEHDLMECISVLNGCSQQNNQLTDLKDEVKTLENEVSTLVGSVKEAELRVGKLCQVHQTEVKKVELLKIKLDQKVMKAKAEFDKVQSEWTSYIQQRNQSNNPQIQEQRDIIADLQAKTATLTEDQELMEQNINNSIAELGNNLQLYMNAVKLEMNHV
ncbi:hypothetical protein MP228_007533 [Amoeboaphelidium protococcarum]|nr:hypothetical protein MP228_007533 [Amoeboaphelidium protococcarum]